MSEARHRRTPDPGKRELRRMTYSAVVEALMREAFVVILRELGRRGLW